MTRFIRKLSYVSIVALLTGCGGSSSKKEEVNLAPSAQITMDSTEISEQESISFSAEQSTDPNGDSLTYHWRILTESGEEIALENDQAKTFNLTLDNFGQYTAELVVKDASLSSPKVSQVFNVKPSSDDFPYVRIKGDDVAKIGAVNWFNGEGSSGGNGQDLAYSWSLIAKPENSQVEMEESDQVRAYFIADVVGDYKVQLVVTNVQDKLKKEKEFTIRIDDVLTNSAPKADISLAKRNFAIGEQVQLDASTSYDVDGDELTFIWTMYSKPDGSQSALNIHEERASFVPDIKGYYQVKLLALDESLQDQDTVVIEVTDGNVYPIADAGQDRTVAINTFIELDASASYDQEGQSLKYEWSLVSKPENSQYNELAEPVLSDYSKFVFNPDVIGNYTFKLNVHDGQDYSIADRVQITVIENARPVAVLQEDRVVQSDSSVYISGLQSYDPEEQLLKYKWEIITAPEGFDGELEQVGVGDDSFAVRLAPTLIGNYTVQLIVNDGAHDSIPETINIVREEAVIYTREVTGKLVDAGGNPIPDILLGGVFMHKSKSNEDGVFNVTMARNKIDISLRVLTFHDGGSIHGYLRLPEFDPAPLDLGNVVLPVMQRKDVSLVACDGYTGPENIRVSFIQSSKGYENMRFRRAIHEDFKVGDDARQILLPANAEIELRLSSFSLSIEAADGKSKFDHQYQENDSQVDPLALTVCK